MNTDPLVRATVDRLPAGWLEARLEVSRSQGVLLCHRRIDEDISPGADVVRLAQELLDVDLRGRPFQLELRHQAGQWRATCLADEHPEEEPVWNEDSVEFWECVSQERRQVYGRCFGPYPELVHKMPTLLGFWPGGVLVQIPYEGAVLTASSGLSNFGLPTPVGVYESLDEYGQPCPELGPRRRRLAPANAAGYGYEFLMLTPELESWPLLVLGRLLEKELLEDTDFLGKVHQHGCLTVDSLHLSAEWVVHVLIAPADNPLPESVTLSNGTCEFLVVRVISSEELVYGLSEGHEALLEHLAEEGADQVSDLELGGHCNSLQRARQEVEAGSIAVLQKGKPVDITTARGPIRLRQA